MRKYNVILFDLDGTVADTDEMIVQTMNILYDKYRDGKRTPREEVYYFSGPPIYETLDKEFPGCDLEFMHSEFRRVSIDLYPSTVTSYPDCKETLMKLKEMGYKLGVVTNKIHSSTLFCLKLIGLEGVFDSLVDTVTGKYSGRQLEAISHIESLDAYTLSESDRVTYYTGMGFKIKTEDKTVEWNAKGLTTSYKSGDTNLSFTWKKA